MPPSDVAAPSDLPLLQFVTVTGVRDEGPLTVVDGWTLQTPSAVLATALELDGWKAVQGDDEGFEAEVVLVGATSRVFVRVRTFCGGRSTFEAVRQPTTG